MHAQKTLLSVLVSFSFVAVSGVSVAAENPADGDIRSLKIGMHVRDVPAEHFKSVTCKPMTEAEAVDIGVMSNFAKCPADPDGMTTVQMHYAPIEPWNKISDRFSGTKLAGHPVNLYVRVGADSRIHALRAQTDPEARRYLRKKAFLLSLRIKGRYGREDWVCERQQPNAQKQRVGGMFIDETCKKQLDGRDLLVHTRLYRRADQGIEDFTGGTELEILGPGVQPG